MDAYWDTGVFSGLCAVLRAMFFITQFQWDQGTCARRMDGGFHWLAGII